MFRTDHADLNLSTSWLTLAGVIIFFSQPAKQVSVLHDKVKILFAGKSSLRKKIAYKLMESVFWVVKVYTLYVLCIFKILTMNNVIYN